MKQLIINADDFGLHELINEGIIEGHTAGCITSTSIMANGEAFEQAAQMAEQHPGLGVGVHLTLVGGASPVARGDIHTLLTPEGLFFPNYGQFIARYIGGKISKTHIEYELRCQLQKVAGRGIRITHVDSHQHLHVLPGITEVVGKIAKEFKVNKVRIPAEPINFLGAGPFRMSRFVARAALTGCSWLARRKYKKGSFSAPQHFFGMLAGGTMLPPALQYVIENLPDGVSEIMVHPGKNTEALRQLFPWGYHWQEEMTALKSKKIADLLQKEKIKLIHFGELEKLQ
ncbi:hypothetical protein P22_0007 [Propionispora sp. 2/2-37]|uniref:ChbG/HpnK family deacetylase n=1 Tax=Propionispora sp. 2/2-37 TaxID=1677858 RepID=UPI0006BB5D8E|nr:ChbG/HpnK family deacetylase [Propionispora sp. 2/2-37]CUH93945.1 hypothetical protein P22_0007 [Propionispora sp. 2/2-37]